MTDGLEPDPLLRFEWADSDAASTAVIEAVSSAAHEDATEMPPLYETLDPDALDTLFTSPNEDGTPRSVEFSYNGYRVAVDASGEGWVA